MLVLAQVLANRAGVRAPEPLIGIAFYAAWTAWTVHRARGEPYGFDVEALLAAPVRRADWRYLLLVVPLIAVSAMALYLTMLALSFLAPDLVAGWIATPEEARRTAAAFPADVVENAVGAAAEELVFRGVLLHLWAARFGVRFAVLATSALFAAGHADVLGAFVFAVVMAALYVRTGTLAVPIVAHFVGNVLVDVVQMIPFGEQGGTLAEFREDWWIGLAVFAAALAVIAVVVRRSVPWPWDLPPIVPRQTAARASANAHE